jgi:hypothetical protein
MSSTYAYFVCKFLQSFCLSVSIGELSNSSKSGCLACSLILISVQYFIGTDAVELDGFFADVAFY